MSLIPHHTSDAICALCEQKLGLAHETLQKWFHAVKAKYPDVHVSWSYRDQQSQEDAYLVGATHLHYPDSAHNKTPAMALDLFQIDDAGKAFWDAKFCAQLASDSDYASYALKWGGNWKSLGDNDHFELVQP